MADRPDRLLTELAELDEGPDQPDRLSFRVSVHALPSSIAQDRPVDLDGVRVVPITITSELGQAVFPRSFEQVQAELDRLPRMFFEPDGSFVWVGEDPEGSWQLDGIVTDLGVRVQFVELHGACPPAAIDQLLRAFGWPETPLMFQLTRQGILLNEWDFRRWAARG